MYPEPLDFKRKVGKFRGKRPSVCVWVLKSHFLNSGLESQFFLYFLFTSHLFFYIVQKHMDFSTFQLK
jgi:hypothetical protein